jgi:hypothetical protein
MNTYLVDEYKAKIDPILPMAKKAYGARTQNTPAHIASREYTQLLTEFYNRGGSLPALAIALDVAYAGIRRRIIMQDVMVSKVKPRMKPKTENIEDSITRIRDAKPGTAIEYHDAIAKEYEDGVSLAAIARGLGLSSAAPLYYGVQRSLQRRTELIEE